MHAIATRIAHCTKLYANDVIASSYAAVASEPARNGTGFFKMASVQGDNGLYTGSNILALFFFGRRSAADNETFSALINGWQRIGENGTQWFPVPLLELTLTQGTYVGAAGLPVENHHYFTDTIVVANAYVSAASYEVVSPVGNLIGMAKIDMAGCEFAEVQLKTGTNAGCNALARPF
jgi:hypothetical protein